MLHGTDRQEGHSGSDQLTGNGPDEGLHHDHRRHDETHRLVVAAQRCAQFGALRRRHAVAASPRAFGEIVPAAVRPLAKAGVLDAFSEQRSH